MILFEGDWELYPTADIHLDTKNESFVDICYILGDMGIKNNLWPLALVDQDLKYIDPHQWDHLSLEEKTKINDECFVNPWYYFREVARVPVEGSLVPSQIRATRGHLALWWCYFTHVTTFLIMPRQCGKSVGMAALDRYLLNIGMVRSSIHLLTKQDDLRRNDVKRIKEFELVLPPYLQRHNKRTDPNNQENVSIAYNGNSYHTHVPRGDQEGAYKVGRGFTSANIRIDEFAYIPWIEPSLTTIISTTNAAFRSAEENNSHHGIILSTTAGKKDTRDGKFAYKILNDSFPFTDKIYDCANMADFKTMILAGSTNGYAINCTFSHRQVGLTDEQHHDNVKKAMISKEAADRDYFNVWTSGSLGSPLTADQLGAIRASQREKFHAEVDTNPSTRYLTKWYVSEKHREEILQDGNVALGVDTSNASGKDEIAMQYVDLNSLELLGTSYINMTNLIEFAIYVYRRLMQYPKLTLIMERQSSAPAILDKILSLFQSNGQNAFRRIFNRVVQEHVRFKEIYDDVRAGNKYVLADLYTTQKAAFGFVTGSTGEYSRSLLYGQVLQNAVRHSMDRVNDIKTIDQIMALEIINDRVDHPKGGHDDGVVAWLLPHWLAQFGNNLQFYGIDTSTLMSDTLVTKQSEIVTREDVEQQELRTELELLLEKLRGVKDPILSHRLTTEIRNVSSRIISKENETFSLTEMIKNVRENKRTRGPGSSNFGKQLGLETSLDKFELLY